MTCWGYSTTCSEGGLALKAAGIDLAASVRRPTGLAIVDRSLRCTVSTVYGDDEITSLVSASSPDVVVIDAPLSVPRGRSDIDDRTGPHFRKCDLELRRLKIRFFPITLGAMRQLTKRGISLKLKLQGLGFDVIESFPGGIQDVLKIPRHKDMAGLLDGLIKNGLNGCTNSDSEHELDAATMGYLGLLYLDGKAVALGDPGEGLLYLPKITC
ncbi:MAG: DUF429 domain-containing protein [Nitrososphaerota archaeon]|nr:DUF429 domain-containing protein [Nitrososphaerota archaeon]MDG6931496.1 DUF429 domain-containing protein [Nitrososphaerota archaeon]MDG6936399.1 DUF429 domain-containing protein [Nitrososphaerota archaeon]MDG6944758.1 DUF429 domain-containing protein [Nitrososphaerota archaeon]